MELPDRYTEAAVALQVLRLTTFASECPATHSNNSNNNTRPVAQDVLRSFPEFQRGFIARDLPFDAAAKSLDHHDSALEERLRSLFRTKGIELGLPLNKGNTATIYRARTLSSTGEEQFEIIKVMMDKRATLANWRYEMTIQRRIGHLNVLHTDKKGNQIHDDQLMLYCLSFPDMQLMQLRDFMLLQQQKQKEGLLAGLQVMKDVCLGMSYLHGHRFKYLHRDLHIDNIMVNKEGRAVIIDFGTAVSLVKQPYCPPVDDLSRYGVPEIEKKSGVYTVQSDIFQFGVVFWWAMHLFRSSFDIHIAKLVEDLILDCIEPTLEFRLGAFIDVLIRLDRILARVSGHNHISFLEACERGHVEVVQGYLAQGHNIEEKNTVGHTGLYLAMQRGHERVVEALVASGADIRAMDLRGNTALHELFYQGHRNVIEMLLRHPQRYNILPLEIFHYSCLQSSLLDVVNNCITGQSKVNINDVDNQKKNTGLHVACNFGQATIVRELLDLGADPAIKNADGWTPLHLAALHGDIPIAFELLTALASRGELGKVNEVEQHGRTPLIMALANEHAAMVAWLLQQGADPRMRADETGISVLGQAKRANLIHILPEYLRQEAERAHIPAEPSLSVEK